MNLKKQVDIAKWKNIKMLREDNKKVFKANRNEEEPKFGAGSEFGKDAKEEARRKKFGIISKVVRRSFSPDGFHGGLICDRENTTALKTTAVDTTAFSTV